MSKILGAVLVAVGLSVGYIIASVLGAGRDINLAIGILLVITGAIIGFSIEWFIDESIRKNRELQRELEKRDNAPAAMVAPALLENRALSPNSTDSALLSEILQQLKTMKEAPQAVAAISLRDQDSSSTLVEVMRQHQQDVRQLDDKLGQKEIEIDKIQRKFEAYQKSHPDELVRLKGIGSVFQRKLRDVGFNSFERLATADPDQIRGMLDIKSSPKVDVESWVQQAKDWVEHN